MVNQDLDSVVLAECDNLRAGLTRADLTQHAHHLFLQGTPVSWLRDFVLIEQGFDLTDRHATLNPAFDLLDTQDVVVVKLSMSAFTTLRF